MFGEYVVYVNDKPTLPVCDDVVFVKILPCLDALMADAGKDYPYNPEKYPGVKEHYILDIDNAEPARDVVRASEPVTPLPKPRKKKGEPK
jgi:TfoX/Sxy family transcriptional regulator of competence genes